MSDNLKEVAERISNDIDNITRVAKYQKIAKEYYKKNCVSACLDGVEGKNYSFHDKDPRVISINFFDNTDYTLADVDNDYVLSMDEKRYITNVRGRRIYLSENEQLNEDTIKSFVQKAVIPELNAYRFAYLSSMLGNKEVMDYQTLLGESFEDEIITFVSSSIGTNSMLNEKIVPDTQFFSGIDLYEGKNGEIPKGGFRKHKSCGIKDDKDAENLKYLALNKNAVFTVARFELRLNEEENTLAFVLYHDLYVRERYKNLVCWEGI